MPSDLGLGPAEVGAAGGAVDGKCPGAGGVQRAVGQRAIGRVAPDSVMKAGEVGQFAIDTRKLCLFDPQTEMLLA